MLYAMFIAHLMGDYVLQWGALARWKTRSTLGVLAHGGVVTLCNLACAALVDLAWWPYALLIGAVHTLVDLARARVLHPRSPREELGWYLADQSAHLATLAAVVAWSGAPVSRIEVRPLADPRLPILIVGYILLLNPAWVLLRFVARAVWGPHAAPPLGEGEKVAPMIERVLIATCIATGAYPLALLVLLPRCATTVRVEDGDLDVTGPVHWGETTLSVALAVVVGLFLRLTSG